MLLPPTFTTLTTVMPTMRSETTVMHLALTLDDAFASYFDDAKYGDANNAFGNYGDAFGADSSYDAFGDLSFGDYDINAAYGSDVADDAGRPVEAADDDDYDGKTTFEEADADN